MGERARLVHAGVHEYDPVAGGQRPGVAVGYAGPGQRQAQAPDARQHPVAAPQLPSAGGLGHGRKIVFAPGSMPEATATATDVEAQTEAVARSYFAAVAARDVEGMIEHWDPHGVGRFIGDREVQVPDGYRREFGQIFAALPDFDFQITDLYARGEQATVRWRMRGTFSGERLINPNPIHLYEGLRQWMADHRALLAILDSEAADGANLFMPLFERAQHHADRFAPG